MGRYKNGIQGPFSGKIGSVIGSHWRGIDYMKSLPRKSGKQASQAQLNQRLKFALVSGWLKPLRELIWIGYRLFAGAKTPMNGAISFHLKEAVTGGGGVDYVIDFARAIFSRGELLISVIKEVIALIDGLLQIKWDNVAASALNRETDKATFIVYNPAKGAFVTFRDVAERGAGEVKLQLPAAYAGDALHAWMLYANAEGDAVSTSVYLGELVLV